MRIALAQVDSVPGGVEKNLKTAQTAIEKAREQRADLVVFPELSLTGSPVGQADDEVALAPDSEPVNELVDSAGRMSVVFGFCEEGRGLQTYNSAAYFDSGRLVHLHRKLFLPTYGVYEERKHYAPGQSMRAFRTGFGWAAMLVCNDVWQPPLPFIAVQDGAQILIIPANSGHGSVSGAMETVSYWREMNRFYARMYQSYVVFVNRVGEERGLSFWGLSSITDPWGETVVEAPQGEEGVVTAEIEMNAVRRRRREAPLIREARLALMDKEIRRLAEEGGDL